MQSTETEIWKPVRGFYGRYEVSSRGRVRSVPRLDRFGRRIRGGMRKTGRTAFGHVSVTLISDGRKFTKLVHTLVLEAFVGARPRGMEACHNNGDPGDNTLGNLRWDTHKENVRDTIRHGSHLSCAQTECKRGHRLEEPNLITSKLRLGIRACHACALASSHAHTRGISIDPAVADKFYHEIMTGAYRPMRGIKR